MSEDASHLSNNLLLVESQIDPNWNKDEGFKMGHTVDGTHFLVEEPSPFTPKAASFKFGKKAGLAYEICLCTHRQMISWLNGPFLAGVPDIEIAKEKLIEAIKLKQTERGDKSIRVVSDDGYFSMDLVQYLAFRNEFDPRNLAYFKDRALARHERINGRMKNFRILDEQFRHDRGPNPEYKFPRHKATVESLMVTLQLELNHGEMSLFDPYP